MTTVGRRPRTTSGTTGPGTTDITTAPAGLVLLLDRVTDSLLGLPEDRELWGPDCAQITEVSGSPAADADLRLRRRAAIEQASRRRTRRRQRRLGLRVR